MRWARNAADPSGRLQKMTAPILQNAINNKQQDGVSYQPVQREPPYLPPPYWKLLPNVVAPMLCP